MGDEPDYIDKYHATVIGCLRPGFVSVVLGQWQGLADGGVPTDVPTDIVPFDLRMPNSVFTLLIDRKQQRFVGVER